MKYSIFITPEAQKMLLNISDKRIQQKIQERIEALKEEPEKQGKALTEDLAGFRSLRAVGQRYRILYKVDKNKVIVVVIALGLRKSRHKKDIYSLAKKLIRLKFV